MTFKVIFVFTCLVSIYLSSVGCKVSQTDSKGSLLSSVDSANTADASNWTDAADGVTGYGENDTRSPLLKCQPVQESSTLLSSHLAYYVASAVSAIAGSPAAPGKKVSILDIRNYYAKQPNHPAHSLSWSAYHLTLDIGGEGRFSSHGIRSGKCRAVNVNQQTKNSQNGQIIPSLVRIKNWDDGYPFADGFATHIMMQGAPLTPKNIDEITRILKNGGRATLDLARADNATILAFRMKMGCINNGFTKSPSQVYTRITCDKDAQSAMSAGHPEL